MAQQLNLFDPRLAPPSLPFSARHGLSALAAIALITVLGVQGLRWAAQRAGAQAQALDAEMAPLQARRQAVMASGAASASGELAQLRTLETGQRRIAVALASGLAGASEGPADYLVALARQASGALWITGFAVSDDGKAVELEGRMTDAAVLSDYLRSLNAEPRFKGRPFAQLSLKSVDSSGTGMPYTEFSLRSSASTSAGIGVGAP